MIVHINFAIILFISCLFARREQSDRTKRKYLLITNTLLGATSAFRYTPYYADYLNYDSGMNLIRSSSMKQIINEFEIGDADAIYRKLLSIISQDNQIYFAVSAFFLAITISIIIYRYSSNVYMSEIVYVSLFFYSLSLNVVRQFIAISFCLLAYKYLIERKCIKYFCIVIIAVLFHPSVIIMVPTYFMVNAAIFENTILEAIKVALFSFVGYIFIRFGLNNQYISYNDSVMTVGYGTENANIYGIIVPLIIIGTIFLARNILYYEKESNKYLINLAYVSLVYYVLSVTGSLIIQRMSLYFSIYTILSIPEIAESRVIKDGGTWITLALVGYYIVWALLGKVNIITHFRF